MEVLTKIHKTLDFILRWFCIILFAALVALVVFQVAIRSTGGNAWTEAMSRIIFIWQGIIGAAYVIGEKDDVAIDFFVRKFPSFVVKALEVLAHLIVAGFAIWVMVFGGWGLASGQMERTVELLPFTQGQIYLILPISGVLIAIYSFLHIITAITTERKVIAEEDIDISTLQEEGI